MKIKHSFIILYIFLSFSVNPAFAEIKSISLQIDGLSCPFCALSLEKKLENVPMVSTVDVHLKKATTDLGIESDMPLDLLAIRKAVKEAGFTLKDIQIIVSGNIKRSEDGFYIVQSRGDQTQFFLFDINHSDRDTKTSKPQLLDGEIEKQLLKAQQENKLVSIKGVVHQHADMPFGLLVQELELNP